ncbi:MAG: T9SS type A sorting domain-containing protein [Flavobacteriales bacterium]|nr:T9SS type A sorting domain-containing protein [Flavobacteriales bacterium]
MKKTLLFLLLLMSTILIKAQFGEQNIISKTISNPTIIETKDIDGDGDLDVIVVADGRDEIICYENLGGWTFSPQRIILKNVSNISSMSIEDFNGDGNLDIVISRSTPINKITWYKNIGGGYFDSARDIFSSNIYASAIYSSDIDNDGDLDLLSATPNNHMISWFENLGNDQFGSQQVITNNALSARDVFSADIDNDGDLDVLSASFNDDKIAWYENTGGGSFGSQQVINYPDLDGNPFNLSNGNADEAKIVSGSDFDNDSDFDVLYVAKNNIGWHENLGGGAFGSQKNIDYPSGSILSVKIVDIDEDGDNDILATIDDLTDIIALYENLGGGIFSSKQTLTTHSGTAYISTNDIDGDGDIDVFSSLYLSDIVFGYENIGGGIMSLPRLLSISSNTVSSIYSSDLDGDGDMDVLSATFGDNKIAWYENLGGGSFGLQKIISTNVKGPRGVHAADLNGDGYIDVLSASGNDDKIAWYENLGNGVFGSQQFINIPDLDGNSSNGVNGNADDPTSVYAIDLDGDGDIDVLSSSFRDDKIAWYENLGNGVFGSQQIITTIADFAQFVFAIDIDGDGDADVISASSGDKKIAWYENLGGGTFGIQRIISTNTITLENIYAIDLDGDGDVDVLSASFNDDKIAWYENLGGGNFGVQKIISTSADGPRFVYASDLDGDGDADVISASAWDDKIAWYENLGGGNFGVQKIISTNADDAECLFAEDIDGDGDIDILSGSLSDDKIAWYENFFKSTYQLKGKVFYDSNQNASLDSNEFGLSFIQTQLLPNSLTSFTYNTGYYFFATDTGIYTVNFIPNSLWYLTTDSSSYTKTLTNSYPVADSLNFGFYPNTIQTTIESELTGAFPRCNDTINYWVNIRNEGTTTPNGILHLQLDDSISFVSSVIAPDSIVGQHIYWHFDSLFFYAEEMINLQVQMPPFTSMGDTLTSILNVYELDGSNNIVYTNSDTLNQVLVCAYDPNDKTVLPKGTGSQGFIANNQPMEYLIRFQNTGNDTALTVMVRDQLDDNLDWSSLKPLASSHPMQVWIEQDGEAVFKFENIMLLDSNVDFLGSQGFVKFSINQKPNLAPNTPIFNTGHIYFDYNPAVITNTVLNTIDDTTGLPVSVQEITFTETNEIIVFPNPFTEFITIYYKAKINTAYHVSLYDMSGKELLKRENITNNKTEFDVSQLKNGIYIIVGTDTNGKKLFSERIIAQ